MPRHSVPGRWVALCGIGYASVFRHVRRGSPCTRTGVARRPTLPTAILRNSGWHWLGQCLPQKCMARVSGHLKGRCPPPDRQISQLRACEIQGGTGHASVFRESVWRVSLVSGDTKTDPLMHTQPLGRAGQPAFSQPQSSSACPSRVNHLHDVRGHLPLKTINRMRPTLVRVVVSTRRRLSQPRNDPLGSDW
jgi:hypothetical protein